MGDIMIRDPPEPARADLAQGEPVIGDVLEHVVAEHDVERAVPRKGIEQIHPVDRERRVQVRAA